MRASEQHDPQTPRRTRSAIPKGAHFKRAIVSPRIARQKNPNSDSEEDTGDEFNMYDEVTTPSKLFSGPLGPRVNHDTGAAKLFQDLPTEVCILVLPRGRRPSCPLRHFHFSFLVSLTAFKDPMPYLVT